MRAFPIRLFHAILFGLVLGTVLSITSFHMFPRLSAEEPGNPAPGNPPVENPPAPAPPPVLNPTPDDLDGDGMPNTWETQYHHNPQDASDAGADFDNDGLTAVAEYQLNQQTSGVAGNPLGKWKSDTVAIPEEFTGGYFYPVDINGHGDVLVNSDIYPEGNWRCAAFIVSADGVWTEIVNQNDPAGGYLWANDFNDQREVVGAWYSADWSEYQSYKWDPVAGFRPFTFQGGRAESYKINNYGDWLGSVENPVTGEWTPAFVVDGINQHAPGDWWSYLSYTDLNDYGEAMGSYYNPQTGRYNTFLAHGGWSFDTGLLGNLPVFDRSTYSYSWSSAMNAYGEFTGGAGGYQNNQWSYMGFHFDGEFNEISLGGRDLHYLSPGSLNSANTILGYADDHSGHYGAFIYRDGVGLYLDELLPGSDAAYSSRINEMGRFVAVSQDYQRISLVSPDQDQDGDGMSDDWEDFHGLDKTSAADAFADADGDGNNNLGEYLLLSDPNAAPVYDPNGNEIDTRPGIDTDGDGIPNVWEWENGLNYDDASDAPLDYDRDGYTNLQEFRLNTDPRGAPSYRIREVGPFQGASSASLSSAVLGDGTAFASYAGQIGANVTESVFFPAKPTTAADGGQRPAAWSLHRSAVGGYLSFTPSHGSQNTNPVAQAPGGASLCYFSGSPTQFVYWASSSSAPVMLSGASSANDISYLYNAKLSPSGNFLVATRAVASASGVYQPIIWKMPLSATATIKPIRLIPPAGVTLSDWAAMHVNDYGYVVATGTVGGQNRPILWTINETGTAVTSSILPPLPGGIWASVSGISNQSSPLICGTSAITGGQSRATVWNASGIATNLGTLPGGSYSTATVVSRGGKIAGLSNVLVGNTLKYQPFLASYDPASATWKLQVQGTPGSYPPSLQLVNDSGEILGRINEYTPAYRQVSYLWRHGRAYPLDALIPASSGHTLDTIKSINPNGTLLATTWKDGARMTVILTPDSDTDGDGLPDAFENQHAFNAFVKNNPATDSDSDGLTDLDEYRNGTQPRNPDTDNDGMKDGWEVSWGLLPLDPSDAILDPDEDHVTNLRESQIGTIPTGIYKVETRLTDMDSIYPNVIAASHTGQIIHTWQSEYASHTLPDGMQYSASSQQVAAQPASSDAFEPIFLPSSGYYQSYNSDWSRYSYGGDNPSYYIDSTSGTINVFIQRYSYSYDGSNYSGFDTAYLLPDAANPTDESWIPWDTIQSNLQGVLSDETLYPYPEVVSSSGNQRIHRTSNYRALMLDASGNLLAELPMDLTWQTVNNHGHAAAASGTYVSGTAGQRGYVIPEVRIHADGTTTTHTLPHTPGVDSSATVNAYSDDGKILVTLQSPTPGGVWKSQYHLLDSSTGTMIRVRQPGLGMEPIVSLSAKNQRLLGTGPKPFQITPDGTCIRLESLRIKNSLADPPLPLSDPSLYPESLTPNHIASDGRITVTTTNNNGQTVILQLAPSADADSDGVPDDWEMDFRDQLVKILGLSNVPANAAEFDVDADYSGYGIRASTRFATIIGTGTGSIGAEVFPSKILGSIQSTNYGDQYNGKLPIKYRSFLKGAIAWGGGYFASSDEIDSYVYGKLVVEKTGTITTASQDKSISETETVTVKAPIDHEDSCCPSDDFPVIYRFRDPYCELTGNTTITSTYTVGPNDPPETLKSKTEHWEYEDLPYDRFPRSDCHDGSENDAPEVATEITKVTKDGTSTESAGSHQIDVTALWCLPPDEVDDEKPLESTSEHLGITTTTTLSEPKSRRTLALGLFDLARSKAGPPTTKPTDSRAIWSGLIPDALVDGQLGAYYTEVQWCLEGPPDADHLVLVTKILSKADGQSKTEYKVHSLKAGTNLIISEAAIPGDDGYDYAYVRIDLLPVGIAVDANRDGEIDIDDEKTTTGEKPFRFWINNDMDNVENDEPIEVSIPDSSGAYLTTKRDLEDFCRLKIRTELPLDELRTGRLRVALKFSNVTQGSPDIRVWKNQSDSGDAKYLTNGSAAGTQLTLSPYLGGSQFCCEIPASHWNDTASSTLNLIFEGVTKGRGELAIVVLDEDGATLGEAGRLWLHLLDIREMYQRARVKNEAEQIPDPWADQNPPAQTWNWDWNGNKYDEDPQAEPITCVMVHGWRMQYKDFLNWSDTTYKRLWHQGYKGKFYSFRWSTYSADNTVFRNNTLDKWQEKHFPVVPGGFTYNPSEYRAWLCGPALANFVNQLPNAGRKQLFAHSMGNVITGAALREGMIVDHYALCNAAMAAMAYDSDPLLKTKEEHPPREVLDGIFAPGQPEATPDMDYDPAICQTYGLEGKFDNLPKSIKLCNFGLPNDAALGQWSSNNMFFKPETSALGTGIPHYYSYVHEPLPSQYKLQFFYSGATRQVTSVSEAMAYVTKSLTRAAGADLRTTGAINDGFHDMGSWSPDTDHGGFGSTHSAQWRWNNQSTNLFWKMLKTKLKLELNESQSN